MLTRITDRKIPCVCTHAQYQPLPSHHFLLGGGQSSVPNFEKGGGGGRGQEKNECLRSLKEFLPQIFARGTYVSCQKRLCKMKYGFEG